MEVSVADVARARGVSERRVLQMVHSGELDARRVGGRWLIDERELGRRRRLGRPMGARMAWALIAALSGEEARGLDPVERSRLRERLARLAASPEPAALLSSWLRERAEARRLSAPAGTVRDLLTDARVVPSGISDPRSGLSASDQAEGYVHPSDITSIVRDYLLIPSGDPNVWLRVAEVGPGREAPLGLVIADLADHNGPREDAQVRRLVLRT